MSTTDQSPSAAVVPTPVPGPAPYDPARSGLMGIYALRVLDHGGDPRLMVNAHRSLRYANGPSRTWEHTPPANPEPAAFGRLAATRKPVGAPVPAPQRATSPAPRPVAAIRPAAASVQEHAAPARPRRLSLPALSGLSRLIAGHGPAPATRARRFATAGMVAALTIGFGAFTANAQDAATNEVVTQEYVVQPGDTIASIAETFSVEAQSIATASGLEGVDYLTPDQIVLIPLPAAPESATGDEVVAPGAAPVVTGAIDAYVIAEGDTLGGIAAAWDVPAAALIELNGITNIDDLVPGTEILIPIVAEVPVTDQLAAFEGSAPATEPVAAAPIAPVTEVANVPTYQQSYPLSSPYAAATIATAAFGAAIPESAFVDAVPLAENPHWGYRGNLFGEWGSTTDYGVYPEPLIPVLNANGFAGEAFYAGGESAALTARIDAGQPVIVWLGLGGESAYWVADEGAGSYELSAGMVAAVAYGYDDTGVFVSNPLTGTIQFYAWDEFMAAWNVLGGMSLSVAPF